MDQISDTLMYPGAFPAQSLILNVNDSHISPKAKQSPSIFSAHELPATSFIKKNNLQENSIEPFWLLIGSLIILALLNIQYYRYYKLKILGFFLSKYNSLNIEKEDRNTLLSRILNIVYFVNVALLITHSILILKIPTPLAIEKFEIYWFVFLFILVFSIVKSLAYIGFGFFFSNYSHILTLLRINNDAQWVATLLLIPLNFIFLYASNSSFTLFFILSILLIIFLIKQLKLYFNIRRGTSYYNYQIILYLCSLEILPLLIILRYLIL